MNENGDCPKKFFYQDELYPFDFRLFVKNSLYFSKIHDKAQNESIFNLLDEFTFIPQLSADSINLFISFCQDNQIKVNNSNICPIYSNQ